MIYINYCQKCGYNWSSFGMKHICPKCNNDTITSILKDL